MSETVKYRFRKVGTYERQISGGAITICTQMATLRAPVGEFTGEGVEVIEEPAPSAEAEASDAEPKTQRQRPSKGK